ncbi:MAG: bifunctional diguanylate cyclase/phosphodiesterase, partial [Oscillospiraceae bacterium]
IVQNRKSKHTLEKIAYYDELTNAPTLAKFKIEAQNFINANPNKNLLMVKFDIYQFKLINQILGNTVGDTVIKNIVNSLRINNPGKYQRYARLHDDEFLVLHIYEKLDDIAKIEEKFENIFYELMGKDFNYNIKIISGVYHMIYENCTNAVDAIEKANIAHRKAKQSGQDLYVYDKSLVQKLLYQKDIENNMQSALQKNEFKVFLQPKYELKSEKIVGAEALVRWQKPDGILVSPSEFIPIFENNGFITKLDMYMFEQVCKIIKGWIDLNLPVIHISVNFSRNHLLNYNFINELIEISEKYHVPRKYIEIELTETVIFENEELIEAVLHKIHSAGFTFSMDDFGTGYSSLGLLKNLPVDVIKIDRSFFTNSKYIARANYVVESVMIMAKKLNIYTVAEGIEEIEQIDFLKKIGCDIVQGFYYAKPMPADDFYEFAKLNNKNK